MAVFMGIFLPVAETVRRFNQLADLRHIMYWFDDYILGGILILAAFQLKSGKPKAMAFMIASWGVGTGALFLSFLGQLDYVVDNNPDPGGIFSVWFIFVAKFILLVYMIIGMIKSIRLGG